MINRKVLATVTICLFAILVSNTYACGESLFRVGKGVSFREYSAPLPGSILVVANTEAEMAMVDRLAAAGHDIHVVSDPSEIGAELQNHDVDIVLAYYSQREFVEAQMSKTLTATFIPVAQDGTQEVSQADALYQQSLTNDDSVLEYLKTIHRTLRSQS